MKRKRTPTRSAVGKPRKPSTRRTSRTRQHATTRTSGAKRASKRPSTKKASRARASTRRKPVSVARPQQQRRAARRVKLPFANGTRGVAVTRRRDRSLMGRYWNAVHKYVSTGDASALTPFANAHVLDARGRRVPVLTDVATLDRLAAAGVLSFEEIYGRRI